jgi:hypothetical protein
MLPTYSNLEHKIMHRVGSVKIVVRHHPIYPYMHHLLYDLTIIIIIIVLLLGWQAN